MPRMLFLSVAILLLVIFASCAGPAAAPTATTGPAPKAATPLAPTGATPSVPITVTVPAITVTVPAITATIPAITATVPAVTVTVPTVTATIPASITVPAITVTVPAGATVGATVQVVNDPKLGNILADTKGMTVYTFDRDQPNVSNCYDQCAQNWPAVTLPSGQPPVPPPGLRGALGTFIRTDGSTQVTYNQKPLYYYIKDTKPGDTTGDGVGGAWHVVKP